MAEDMGKTADVRAASLGFRSFSAYVQHLIRDDLISGGDITLRETPVNNKRKPAKPRTVSSETETQKAGRLMAALEPFSTTPLPPK